eukprot:Em0010g675a
MSTRSFSLIRRRIARSLRFPPGYYDRGKELFSTDICNLLQRFVADLTGIKQFTAYRTESVNFEFMKKVSDFFKQLLYIWLNSLGKFDILIAEERLFTAIEDKLDVINLVFKYNLKYNKQLEDTEGRVKERKEEEKKGEKGEEMKHEKKNEDKERKEDQRKEERKEGKRMEERRTKVDGTIITTMIKEKRMVEEYSRTGENEQIASKDPQQDRFPLHELRSHTLLPAATLPVNAEQFQGLLGAMEADSGQQEYHTWCWSDMGGNQGNTLRAAGTGHSARCCYPLLEDTSAPHCSSSCCERMLEHTAHFSSFSMNWLFTLPKVD